MNVPFSYYDSLMRKIEYINDDVKCLESYIKSEPAMHEARIEIKKLFIEIDKTRNAVRKDVFGLEGVEK